MFADVFCFRMARMGQIACLIPKSDHEMSTSVGGNTSLKETRTALFHWGRISDEVHTERSTNHPRVFWGRAMDHHSQFAFKRPYSTVWCWWLGPDLSEIVGWNAFAASRLAEILIIHGRTWRFHQPICALHTCTTQHKNGGPGNSMFGRRNGRKFLLRGPVGKTTNPLYLQNGESMTYIYVYIK